jgi:uncharacterized protein
MNSAATPVSELGDLLFAFLSIVWEGLPFIVLGTILSGLVDAFLPSTLLDRMLPRNRWLAVVVSALFGAILPVCECAIVPVIRRLVGKGLPVACAVTYMLAAPVINPITALSTFSAFKNDTVLRYFMPGSRLLMAFLITVIVGWIVTKMRASAVLHPRVLATLPQEPTPPESPEATPAGSVHKATFEGKLTHAMRTAMNDLLDTGMYFTIGALITAVFNTKLLIRPDFQSVVAAVSHQDWLAVPSLMGLAVVLSLCSTTDAFIAAALSSFSWLPKLAFLVFGPMVDLKLMFMYSTIFRRSFVVKLILALAVLVCLFCALFFSAASPFLRSYGHAS